ncbi:TetR family transcriptional regulator [Bifidobacterium moukalabense DSM 27321]|uniref:TetR family transcriptional regulator n=1 Tax=Bifidobacterium moukalabense DSM 27321 TaxID=1435051 RepID=W4N6B0_9BIFI|nr:TetR family transcriptional regulator [Bifidobacterium moukalabense DSM 27321]
MAAKSEKEPEGSQTHSRLGPAERREQIIDAASQLISRNGFWGFSVRQVAAQCDLTEPAVIYHFKNKVGLLIAVLERRDREDMAQYSHSLGVEPEEIWNGDVRFGIRSICDVLMARNAKQPEIVRLYTILQGESLSDHHPAYEYYQKRERRVISMLTRAAEYDGLERPRQEARMALSVMDGIQLRWLRDPEGVDLMSLWHAYADARWRDASSACRVEDGDR